MRGLLYHLLAKDRISQPSIRSFIAAALIGLILGLAPAASLTETEDDVPASLPLWLLYLAAKEQPPYDPSAPCQGSEHYPERLFLQQVGPDRAIIKWRDSGDSLLGVYTCLLYTSPSPRDRQKSRMPSSA